MKDFVFTNEAGTFELEFKTDHLDNHDNFTVHDIIFNSKESGLIIDDVIRAGLDYRRLPYTLAAFDQFAETNNYKLNEIDWAADQTTTRKSATALSITTTTIKNGTDGTIDVQTITIPTTAGATQADYIVIENYDGETVAVWLDIDEAGTVPTGAKFLAADYQVRVPIATGGTAAVNGTSFYNAIQFTAELLPWSSLITIVDNGDGTVEFTQKQAAAVTAADPENADDSGVGSITVSVDTAGVDGEVYAEQIVATGGNTPYVFALTPSGTTNLPAGLSLTSDGRLIGVATATQTGAILDVTVTDVYGQTDDAQLTFNIT